MISAKLGLCAGSCCQHFSRSSVSFGCVSFGIFGLSPCKIIKSHCVEGLSTKHARNNYLSPIVTIPFGQRQQQLAVESSKNMGAVFIHYTPERIEWS